MGKVPEITAKRWDLNGRYDNILLDRLEYDLTQLIDWRIRIFHRYLVERGQILAPPGQGSIHGEADWVENRRRKASIDQDAPPSSPSRSDT